MRTVLGLAFIALLSASSTACAATAMSPADVARERNPRIMGIVTTDGETIRFNRQLDTITWQSDTLRVQTRAGARRFAADQIRSILVDKGSTGRMLAFGIPIGALLAVIFAFWGGSPYT